MKSYGGREYGVVQGREKIPRGLFAVGDFEKAISHFSSDE